MRRAFAAPPASAPRSLSRRRRIASLSAVALLDAAVIALRQMGAIRRLPDPPGRLFDSNQVTTARAAYVLGAPDAALGAAQHALNLVLASARGTRATGRGRVWSWLLLGNAVAGGIGAVGYLTEMLVRQRRRCAYCLVALGVNFALVPLALAEVRESGRLEPPAVRP